MRYSYDRRARISPPLGVSELAEALKNFCRHQTHQGVSEVDFRAADKRLSCSFKSSELEDLAYAGSSYGSYDDDPFQAPKQHDVRDILWRIEDKAKHALSRFRPSIKEINVIDADTWAEVRVYLR